MNSGNTYPGVELRQSSPPTIGEAVLALQLRLAELGFACADTGAGAGMSGGDIAGVFGRRTTASVRAYQAAYGLQHDGIVGRNTWGALFGLAPPAPVRLAPTGPVLMARVDPNARDTDLGKLHPMARASVQALLEDLRAASIPMGVFEAFRSPERQQALFAKGRNAAGIVIDKHAVVTQARPFESYHQYGLAVDIVIQRQGVNPWDTGSSETRTWWQKMHQLADKNGLEPLSWEMPHVQVKGLTVPGLLQGKYPRDGDESWEAEFVAAIERWPGGRKPPTPPRPMRPMRPSLAEIVPPSVPAEARSGWDALPVLQRTSWTSQFGGQRWRADQHGVYLDSVGGGVQPLRTKGSPETCIDIVTRFGTHIQKASAKHGVPPELIVMVIATEVGAYRKVGFTGPETFRWEANVTDYSAGPMQILSKTALDTVEKGKLGYHSDLFPQLRSNPNPRPSELPLYDPALSIDIGTCLIRRLIDRNRADPILVAAAYNAGSVREAHDNPWRVLCYGNHLDRAAEWYGDACEVIGQWRA